MTDICKKQKKQIQKLPAVSRKVNPSIRKRNKFNEEVIRPICNFIK